MPLIIRDGTDLIGIQRPHEIKYIKHLRMFMLFMGGWPGKLFGEPERFRIFYRCYNIVMSTSLFIAGCLYVRNNMGVLSFVKIGQTCITTLMNIICMARFASVFSKRFDQIIVDFLTEIHLFNHRHKSEYSGKMNLYVHNLSKSFTIYSVAMTLTTASIFNISPFITNLSNGGFGRDVPANITYEHSINYVLPFDHEHNFKGFIIVFFWNLYITFASAEMFVFYDLLIALLVFHLWGHLKILTYNLENFPKPGFKGQSSSCTPLRYSDEESLEVAEMLKGIIDHHNFILKHSRNISEVFGLNIAVYYTFFQVSGCLFLLECSTMDPKAVIHFGPLTIGLIALLVQMSMIFELLSAMTDHVIRGAYNVPWECMDVKDRKMVLMLLRQAQIPLGLKALGVVEVGVRTMAAIMKTSLSYFMMLRTFASNE
ncbi:uncharacterized protein LOC106136539 [Amyelois transitella]|uniref:uncharacterized protein LOC106136539 n=1 Tax=Amyelois transitella TaxID=680683 RepID=UPI00298FDD07|nr:uncharacterized protein LOC106136539 [Amyelois transitella]